MTFQKSKMDIKTIHLKNVELLPGNAIYESEVPKLKSLMKELYDLFLKDDTKFHFFFEPELIIRITNSECLEKVKKFLQEKEIKFEEYDYPFPPDGNFGEAKEGNVAKNLELFLTIFHANSVAALTMSEEDHFKYLERLVHTAFNPKFFTPSQEGAWLTNLACLKLGPEGVINLVKSGTTP